MTQLQLNPAWLLERLASLAGAEPPRRWLVAFSGGLDSSVLLHLLARADRADAPAIAAIHIDHGLHPDAAAWSAHCREFAAGIGIALEVRAVEVEVARGDSIEAAARGARYAAIRAAMQVGDCVLTAHHRDDQAETLLLNLLRGSGPAGIAGIGAAQAFGAGRLFRPLLDVSREAIEAYARRHDIEWVEDPSNESLRFDRNFLRREILPALAARWPAVTASLTRSAALASESSSLLQALADIDLAAAGGEARLDVAVLRELGAARARNALRRAVSRCGLPPPPATRLHQAVDELLPARDDAAPRVRWDGAEFRRFRGRLYVLPAMEAPPVPPAAPLLPGETLDLGPQAGSLALLPGIAGGISPALARGGLAVRYRRGGEEIRPAGDDCTRSLKKLLQQAGIVPWMRERLPLLYAQGTLVAVADRWVAAEASDAEGFGVRWCRHPPLT